MSITAPYKRKLTPSERLFTWSPFSVVTVVARIKGHVSEDMLAEAVSKVQQRHVNLRVRITEDSDHVPWFTSEDAQAIPVKIVSRESDEHWIKIHLQESQIPFDFGERPAARFILVQSPQVSELIILCHHIICDGLSLAYLARDVMNHLGDRDLDVDVLPDPVLVNRESIPEEVSASGVIKFFINRINQKWQESPIFFDQEDYEAISAAYWNNINHHIMVVELTEEQTAALVDRCKKESITVNSALAAAFVGAQVIVQGEKPYHSSVGVAGSLRDRLQPSAGEGMGFYAGVVTLKFKYNISKAFWENARQFHRKVKPLFTNRKLFNDFLTWLHLDPAVLEAINFKKLGKLVPQHAARHDKLSTFSQQDDVVLSVLKREQMDTLDKVVMGTAVTNLTRMNFPRQYGELVLDRLILQPGGAFPLTNVNLVLGAVTCSGKLSLVLEFAEEVVSVNTMQQIRDQAMIFLLSD